MTDKLDKILLQTGLSEEELVSLAKSSRVVPQRNKVHSLSRKRARMLVFSDPHIGHEKFHPGLFEKMAVHARKVKPDMILCPGDHLEGMSHRPGHVYELTHIGFQRQIEYAAQLYNTLPQGVPIYGIDGNHDQWFFKPQNAGVVVGSELEARVKEYHNLGQDEGHVRVGAVDIMLFHPNDGSAYAQSYKMQKLIESFTGGSKPHVVLGGHYHKALYAMIRNVHGVECGTLCAQTSFMRGKKLAAHMGYWMIDLFHDKSGVNRIVPEWVPHYE